MQQYVGVAGLGLMGSGIASRLDQAGMLRAVYNRTKKNLDASKNVIWAKSPQDLADSCEIVLTCVTDYKAVRGVLFGDRTKPGIASSKRAGLVVIDASTISPRESEECAQELREHGIDMLSSPVMGGPAAAKEGKLVPMISGSMAAYEKAKPVIAAIGSRHFYIGAKNGDANVLKLALNLNIALIAVAVSEGINLVKASGLDPAHFINVLNSTYFKTGLSEGKGPKMVAWDFSPSFHLKNMLKDISLAVGAARDAGVSIPNAALAEQMFRAANNSGYSDLDYTSVCAFLSQINGLGKNDNKD
ncbi:MAG: NAD(P)-dependent oxidoreductase [Nitrososphaera sp.]